MRAGFFVRSFPGFERDSMTIGGKTIVGVAIKILHRTTLKFHITIYRLKIWVVTLVRTTMKDFSKLEDNCNATD